MILPTYKFETEKIKEGYKIIAGVDEVGIGPLAGPVVAAVVIWDSNFIFKNLGKNKWLDRVRDSKKIKELEREDLAKFIREFVLDYSICAVAHETIDRINILNASHLAMINAIKKIKTKPEFIFIDGVHKMKQVSIEQESVVKGDNKILSIASASILAKVERDKIMKKYHKIYPQYNFVKHKGYPTREHKMLIKKFGPCSIHRKSFKLF